ncbi:unnamed protein product [Bursaphelenchus okinawaensis]|uniref:Potassium channel domain-containing protein n=1 Tax=Bursaphelenchus okinawaensis TaxID=465554 RepID=A0A811KSD2_9BILA|nr:unnamed protein product [Bursaphelenchus okinawaensis]CAG9111155.1 unnamed protein product [Bursaphelenchus okinawaensis]
MSESSLNTIQFDPMSVTQTWPKSRVTNEFFHQANQQLNQKKMIDEARAFIADNSQVSLDGDAKQATDIIQHLCDVIEKLEKKQNNNRRKSRQSIASQLHPMGVIREEPHFESMIFSGVSDISRRASSVRSFHDPDDNDKDQEVDIKELYDEIDPFFVRFVPYAIILVTAILYIFVGALVFASIDPKIDALPYYLQVQFTYEVVTTIGWGDITPSSNWGKMACVLYQIIGVPIVFAALSNCGRLLTEFYTVDFLYLTAVVRGKNPTKTSLINQLPLVSCINLLVVHLFIGILLFSGLIMELSVVDSVYFTIITITTVGFGDIAPKPHNMFETIVVMIFLSSGIVVMAALLVTLSYYFQLIFYGYINDWIYDLYERFNCKRKVSPTEAKSNGFNRV